MRTFHLVLPQAAPARDTAIAIVCALLFLAAVEFLRIAWVCDDSLITIRCVLNALHGYGPSFNIDERVQAFTHPLWFMSLWFATWLLRSPWIALLVLSGICTLASIWLLALRIGNGRWHALLLAALLLVCKPYVDFSSSGLENPLANVLILAIIDSGWRAMRLRGRALWPFTLYGLLYLTRADLALLMAPFSVVVLIQTFHGRKALVADLASASLPVLAWSAFSLCYYGFLVPNTAFAKLHSDIPHREILLQGVVYLLDGLGHDLLALPCMAAAIVVGVRAGWPGRALAAGILLYLLYVVEIGGDFMSGRFLVAPFVAAMACLALHPPELPRGAVQACCLTLLGLFNLASIFPWSVPAAPKPGIAITDERAWWYGFSALTRADRFRLATPAWRKHVTHVDRVQLLDCGGLGLIGLVSGPQLHLADRCALADPLLSHLPMEPDPDWRIGHFKRAVPAGYEASLRDDRNEIIDPAVHALYDDVRLVTRGGIFTWARWGAIWRLNLRG